MAFLRNDSSQVQNRSLMQLAFAIATLSLANVAFSAPIARPTFDTVSNVDGVKDSFIQSKLPR